MPSAHSDPPGLFSAQLRAVADLSCAPLSLHDRRGRLLYANPAALRLLGCDGDVSASGVMALIHREDRLLVRRHQAEVVANRVEGEAIEFRLKDRDGGWHVVEAIATNLLSEPLQAVLVNLRDVTERHEHERHLRDLALHDPLTRLANRALLRRRIDVMIGGGAAVSVALIDIDRFKQVNDSLGHTAGDTVLQAIASRISHHVPNGALVARFEGDVFALVLPANRPSNVRRLVWRLLARVSNPYMWTAPNSS